MTEPDDQTQPLADGVSAQIAKARTRTELNAFISFCSDDDVSEYLRTLDMSLPLAGMIFSAKDNIMSTDFPTTAGSAALRNYRPRRDATIIAQLKAVGAFLVGKNNMPEFCQSMTCNNASYGPVGNPVNTDWIAGGSSGGSAAAVAANLVTFAVGTDTGGSVCIPAALCGSVGYRPSIGRYSTEGLIPVSPSFDTPGLIANSVKDIALIDNILAPSVQEFEIDIESLRIGVPQQSYFSDTEEDVEKLYRKQVSTLEENGATLVQIDLSLAQKLNSGVGLPIAFYEMLREISIFLTKEYDTLSLAELLTSIKGPTEKDALLHQLGDGAVPREAYVEAIQVNWPKFVMVMDELFEQNQLDTILVPTTPLPAIDHRPLGQDALLNEDPNQRVFPKYIQNTELFSNYGGPSISLPVGVTSEGRPVGMLLTGQPHQDQKLMAICEIVSYLAQD